MNSKTSSPPPRRRMGPGSGPPHMHGEKAKDFKGTMIKLMAYMGNYKYAMLCVLLIAVGGTVFAILAPRIMGQAITALYDGFMAQITDSGSIDFALIAEIVLLLLILYVLSACLNAVQGFITAGISQKICFQFRRELSEKINRMPMSYFEQATVGDVLSRITNDIDTIGQNLNQSIVRLITSLAMIIGILIMMLSISPLMTLIALVIMPITVVLMVFVVKHSQHHFNDHQKYLGQLNGRIEEVYGGHNIIRAFNREAETAAEFSETNKLLYGASWKSQFISGLMWPVMSLVGNLGYVAVVVVGALLTLNGTILIGDIPAFIQYMRNFTQPLQEIAQTTNMLQSTVAAAERVFEFLAEAEEVEVPGVGAPHTSFRKCSETQGKSTLSFLRNPLNPPAQIVFDHVRFGYVADKPVIQDFSTTVEAGQMIAIVGPTGAGKTTMVKLLMRFYDVDSGAICVNGRDICSLPRPEHRANFGMVLQDTWLFKGSIMENIRYGKLDATDEEVVAAAKAAYAHRFIMTLPEGYQMELNDDASNVSQGQKQLLTIARAILADRPILILDEATSSVDTRTEERIQKAMSNLMRGRTSFVIAHRLSTIQGADRILVMNNGDIVEQGRHAELLSAGGFYAELYESQFERAG